MNTTLFFLCGSLLYGFAYVLGKRDGRVEGIAQGRREMYEQISREVDEHNARIRQAVAQAQIETALRPPISTLTFAPLGLRSGSAISAPSGESQSGY